MRAEEALAQSSEGLIATDTPRGLVTIFYQPRTEDSAEGFHLRFIPCDAHMHLNAAGTVMVGSYEDLDDTLTIAALSYGTSETRWSPLSAAQLSQKNLAKHAPQIEGRRFIRPDDAAQEDE